MFSQAVPVYYASLGVYSFLAIKHNFHQERFKWIEKWIHAIAHMLPLVLCSVVTASESFNRRGTGCFIAASPFLCEKEGSDEECERGGTLSDVFIGVFAFGNIIMYLIVPPLAMLLVACSMRRTIKEAEVSVGMRQILVTARKQMMQDVMKQISLYLVAFWLTYILPLANGVHEKVTGSPDVNLMIVANCVSSLQGAIITLVYFSLQRMTNSSRRLASLGLTNETDRRKNQLTVSKIRNTAESREAVADTSDDSEDERAGFFIFDGRPSEDSPWAKYLEELVDEEEEQ
jgi:hypothetical protein